MIASPAGLSTRLNFASPFQPVIAEANSFVVTVAFYLE